MGTSTTRRRTPDPATARSGFTLVEMLVAITILVILMVALFSVSAGVANIWKSSAGKVSAFQNARSAFSTLTTTLSRATLNTYSDYTDSTGSFRNTTNNNTFAPRQFARASELHFISGPTVDIATASELKSKTGGVALAINATPQANPGHGVFFQAALGNTSSSDFATLRRAMNSVGFYIQYGPPEANLIPTWLSNAVKKGDSFPHRFRLVEFVEPTESLQIYASTTYPTYTLDWLTFAEKAPSTRVLAEDVLLLIIRPRLSPTDENTVMSGSYDIKTQFGSILCPNYHFDSRAWQTGYPASLRVKAANSSQVTRIVPLMKNQVPPIIDVAMVCADPLALARFDSTSDTPPAAVQVPTGAAGLFTDSSKLETDLAAYADQLSAAHIRFHIMRTAIGVQSAKWSNN